MRCIFCKTNLCTIYNLNLGLVLVKYTNIIGRTIKYGQFVLQLVLLLRFGKVRAHFLHITHAVSQADFTDMKSFTHQVFDRKVGQREKRKKTGPVWFDESLFRENEAEVGVKK